MGEIALLGLVASTQTSKNFRNLGDLPSGKDIKLEIPPFFLLVFRFSTKPNGNGIRPSILDNES